MRVSGVKTIVTNAVEEGVNFIPYGSERWVPLGMVRGGGRGHSWRVHWYSVLSQCNDLSL